MRLTVSSKENGHSEADNRGGLLRNGTSEAQIKKVSASYKVSPRSPLAISGRMCPASDSSLVRIFFWHRTKNHQSTAAAFHNQQAGIPCQVKRLRFHALVNDVPVAIAINFVRCLHVCVRSCVTFPSARICVSPQWSTAIRVLSYLSPWGKTIMNQRYRLHPFQP